MWIRVGAGCWRESQPKSRRFPDGYLPEALRREARSAKVARRGCGVTSSHELPDWDGPLNEPEQALIKHATSGELFDLEGDPAPTDDRPAIELETMQGWGADRTIRAEVLRHLLVESEWPMHAKGVRLRGARITGPFDLDSATLRCPLELADCYFDGEQPVVLDYATGTLFRLVGCWLVGLEADLLVITQHLDLKRSTFAGAVHLSCAKISGKLNCSGVKITGTDPSSQALVADGIKVDSSVFLSAGFVADGAVRLLNADITGQLVCSGAHITGTDTDGNALDADSIKVGGGVFLNAGFVADGAVRLLNADITGQLVCSGAHITGTDTDGNALDADGIKVGGGVFLNAGFVADGAVRLLGADITGPLVCSGAQITGTDTDGNALAADGVKVGGSVFLNAGFVADGAVRLLGADITGPLVCSGAQITGTDTHGNALAADGVKVGGGVFLNAGFVADGAVRLLNADITGQLACRGAQITGTDSDDTALAADGVRVGGAVFLDDGFTSAGSVGLRAARVGGGLSLRKATLADPVALEAQGARVGQALVWAPARPVTGVVNLDRAQVNRIDDDWSNKGGYWPTAGNLRLAGFVYDGFGGDHQANSRQRLDWVRSQHRKPLPGQTSRFGAQPYEQDGVSI
jgi:hypothetical protein